MFKLVKIQNILVTLTKIDYAYLISLVAVNRTIDFFGAFGSYFKKSKVSSGKK